MNKLNDTIETDLIRQAQAGSENAFGKLVHMYNPRLFSFLLRLTGDRHSAEDLFQETCLKVWRNIRSYDQQKNFATWLFAIAHNVSIDALRYHAVRKMVKTRAVLPDVVSGSAPDDEMIADELRDELDRAVGALPEKQKKVFVLRQHSGMSFKDISKLTGESINTTISHMHYALKKMKRVLKREHNNGS